MTGYWVYAQQLEQEQLQAATDAAANVELHTPPSTSSDHVEPALIQKVAKGNTPDTATDSNKSQDKDKTPKGTKKNDLKSGSSKSKQPRLEETLKERTSKELYAAFLESQKKSKEGQSGTKGAGSTRKDPAAKDKAGDNDSDAEVHEQDHGGDEEAANQFSDASEDDQESDAESEDRGHRKGSDDLNKKLEKELEDQRKIRKEEKRLRKAERDAKATAIKRARKREEKEKSKKAREEAFKKALEEEIVLVSSDESSDTAEETISKTLRINNIRMQSKVEEAYHKYVSIYLNPK